MDKESSYLVTMYNCSDLITQLEEKNVDFDWIESEQANDDCYQCLDNQFYEFERNIRMSGSVETGYTFEYIVDNPWIWVNKYVVRHAFKKYVKKHINPKYPGIEHTNDPRLVYSDFFLTFLD